MTEQRTEAVAAGAKQERPGFDLDPPPGYRNLAPLDRERHGGLGVIPREGYPFAAALNAVYLTISEFFQAVRHYPIAFGRDPATGDYLPVAVLGLERGRNLFVDADGRWDRDAYVPAYVRRFPFFSVEVRAPGAAADAMICVDETELSPDAPPLFDRAGMPTEEWTRREPLVNDMEKARRLTRTFSRTLSQLKLFEPFEAHAQPKGRDTMYLRGLYRVEEERLKKVPARTIKELMSRGELSRVYAHLISLENFARLLNRLPPAEDA